MEQSSSKNWMHVLLGAVIVAFGAALIAFGTLALISAPLVGLAYLIVGSGIIFVGCIVVANSSQAALSKGWRRHRYVLLIIAAAQVGTIYLASRVQEIPPMVLAGVVAILCLGAWVATRGATTGKPNG